MDEPNKRPPQCKAHMAIYILYTNWEGETAIRHIIPYPSGMFWGSTEWHKTPQWLIPAWDLDKDAERTYALLDIKKIANSREELPEPEE